MSTKQSDTVPSCFTTTIEHLHFTACLDRLRELVRMKASTRIVIVTGPTAAGKTTLLEWFTRELESLSAPERQRNPEMIAYGACSVKAPGPTAFSWKDTYLQMLSSLQHPFADGRLLAQPKPPSDVGTVWLKTMSPEAAQRLSNDRLFRILQKTITHRQPKALIFDEAHHLLRVASSQSLVNQLEHLKYIADETRTLHVLFGTYELIKLMDLSSALIRRREVVHFSRYIFDPKKPTESLEAFAEVVAVFARDLDAMCDFKLLLEVPYLYQGSVGCVGVLRDWLFRAYSRASEKSRKITKGLLEQTMLAASDKLALIEAAQEGEDYFSRRSLCEKKYLACLGFPVPTEGDEPEKPASGRKNKPFERAPHNDPIGVGNLDPKKQKEAA